MRLHETVIGSAFVSGDQKAASCQVQNTALGRGARDRGRSGDLVFFRHAENSRSEPRLSLPDAIISDYFVCKTACFPRFLPSRYLSFPLSQAAYIADEEAINLIKKRYGTGSRSAAIRFALRYLARRIELDLDEIEATKDRHPSKKGNE